MSGKTISSIVSILNEYSNKIADATFFNKILLILTDEYDVNDYVNDLIIIKSDKAVNSKYKKYTDGYCALFSEAAYEFETHNIIIWEKNIISGTIEEAKECIIDNKFSYLFINLIILQKIMHELEHAVQRKNIKEGKDLESELFRCINSDEPENTLTYEFSPFERLAELKSLTSILPIAQHINDIDLNIINYFYLCINSIEKSGYKYENGQLISPFEQYINVRNCNKERALELASYLKDSIKYFYGVPISLDEYNLYNHNNFKHKM